MLYGLLYRRVLAIGGTTCLLKI